MIGQLCLFQLVKMRTLSKPNLSLRSLEDQNLSVSFILREYASEIIKAESQIQHNYCYSSVKQLTQLYQLGIELYSAKNPKKAKYLKKKLQNLAGHKNFIATKEFEQDKKLSSISLNSTFSIDSKEEQHNQSINIVKENKTTESQTNISTLQKCSSSKKVLTEQLKTQIQLFKKSASDHYENLIVTTRQKENKNKQLISQTLQKQENQLKQRLKTKRQKKSNKCIQLYKQIDQITFIEE